MQDNAVHFSKYYGMHDRCVIEMLPISPKELRLSFPGI